MWLTTLQLVVLAPAVIGLLCSIILYTYGLASRGKQSLAHSILFDHLRLLSPTTDSVALLAGVPTTITTADADSQQQQQQQQQQQAIPKTLDERLAALELSSATISGGMVAVSAMKNSNNQDMMGRNIGTSTVQGNTTTTNQGKVWKSLEWTAAVTMGCVIAMGVRYSWISLRNMGTATQSCNASDGLCWDTWTMFIERDDSRKLFVVLLAFIAWRAIRNLSRHCRSLYSSPASYVTAWIFGLVAYYWIVPSSASFNNMNVQAAVEELAARWLLFVRLLGIGKTDPVALQSTLETLISVGSFGVAVSAWYLGFFLSESISSMVQLFVYQFFVSFAKRKLQNLGPLMLVVLLPLLILSNGLTENGSTLCCGIFVMLLLASAKSLLQTHLDRALPAVKLVLGNTTDGLTSDQVLRPFTNRYQRLVETGGSILVLPSTLVVLLMLLSITPQMHLSGISPIGYHMNSSARQSSMAGEASTANHLVMEQYKREYLQMAIQNQQSNYWNMELFADATTENVLCDDDAPALLKRGRDLLELHANESLSVTLVGALRNLQKKVALQTEERQDTNKKSDSKSDEKDDNDNPTDDDNGDGDDIGKGNLSEGQFRSVFDSIVNHPFLTSTIARPILHLWMFLLIAWWCFCLFYGLIFSHSIRTEIGTYAFDVEQTDKKST